MSADAYRITAVDYLRRCLELAESKDLRRLFYAALELRFALERTPFDYLVLMLKAANKDPEKALSQPKKYKPNDVFNLARAVDPEIEMKMRFAALMLRAHRLVPENAAILDPRWLSAAHRDCDRYLHAQKDPEATVEDPEWVAGFRAFLTEASATLLSLWRTPAAMPQTLTPAGEAVWEHFKTGNYSDEQIVSMLRLSG